MRGTLLVLLAFAGPAVAYCPEPIGRESHQTCIASAKSPASQRMCAADLQLYIEEVDKWEACKLAELEQRHADERAQLQSKASSRRQSLLSSLPLLLR